MTVGGLAKLAQSSAKHNIPITKYKSVAIDATLYIYQLAIAGESHRIVNKQGKYINHIQGLFYRCISLLEGKCCPIFVFDSKGIAERKIARVSQLRKIPREVFSECKQLLDILKIAHIDAVGEDAECLCARLNAAGRVDAVMSDDYDCLVYGARKMLTVEATNPMTVREIAIKDVLAANKLTLRKLVDYAILAGTDYNSRLMTPAPALREAQKPTGVLAHVPQCALEALRARFLHIDANLPAIDVKLPVGVSRGELREFLQSRNVLNEKKIDNAFARIGEYLIN